MHCLLACWVGHHCERGVASDQFCELTTKKKSAVCELTDFFAENPKNAPVCALCVFMGAHRGQAKLAGRLAARLATREGPGRPNRQLVWLVSRPVCCGRAAARASASVRLLGWATKLKLMPLVFLSETNSFRINCAIAGACHVLMHLTCSACFAVHLRDLLFVFGCFLGD